MRYLRRASLSVIAATALTLMGGLSTALASTTELFAEHSTLSEGAEIDATLVTGTPAAFLTTSDFFNSCLKSTIAGNTTNTTGAQINVSIHTLTWEECNRTTHTDTTGSLIITNIGGGNGTLSGSATAYTITIPPPLSTVCLYGFGTGSHLGELDGVVTSGHGELDIEAAINEQGTKKFACPDTLIFAADYIVTSPTNLNVGL